MLVTQNKDSEPTSIGNPEDYIEIEDFFVATRTWGRFRPKIREDLMPSRAVDARRRYKHLVGNNLTDKYTEEIEALGESFSTLMGFTIEDLESRARAMAAERNSKNS